MRSKVGIFIYDRVEALDVAGPLEVFSVADELNGFALYDTFVFSETTEAVRTVNGLQLMAEHTLATLPALDVLIIPGGAGIRKVIQTPELLNALSATAYKARYVLTVCTGVFVAAKLGWLSNKAFCTHHTTYDEVLLLAPEAIAKRGMRFTGDGRLFSSAGVTAGIELALHVVHLMHGEETTQQVVSYIEYPVKECYKGL